MPCDLLVCSLLLCILSPCWLLSTTCLVRSCSLCSVNVAVGKHEERMLLTGMHTVADVVCIVCDEVVGWKYVCCVDLVCSLACVCLELLWLRPCRLRDFCVARVSFGIQGLLVLCGSTTRAYD